MKTKIIVCILIIRSLIIVVGSLCLAQTNLNSYYNSLLFEDFYSASCRSGTFVRISFENRFLTKNLNNEVFFCNISIKKNNMPILIDHYGNGAYGQLKIASGYGRLFGDRFALSVRFFYLLEHARHYPSRHSFFVDLGFDCKISNKLRMCASISNPFNMRYGIVGGEHIPIIFNVLASCKLSGKMFADLRFSKSFSGGFEVGGSFLYCPLLNFMLDLFCSNFKIDLGINIPLRKFLLSVRSCWFYRVSFAPKLQFSYFHQQKEMP